MILPDHEIEHLISVGALGIYPLPRPAQYQPASLDICLGGIAEDPFVEVVDDGWVIHPGARVLGYTLEKVRLPDTILARLEGRSSLGRKFLSIHCTAGIIDPGWDGQIVLEISNEWPIGHPNGISVHLKKGERVGQLTFQLLNTPCATPYGDRSTAKYQGQMGVTPSMPDKEF